ncbi:MAG: cytochrome c maturation protein CcmE [Acidobacteria bacterium]|nr:cytochrome c maturation protein CcmE [Acidobacteriota bacterium]
MRSNKIQLKFVLGIGLILGVLAWLAYGGIQESKTYYVTVVELKSSPAQFDRRYRVAGDVVPGSIRRIGTRVEFQLEQDGQTLPVTYVGTEPLPDTLRDQAQAVADGRYQADGHFQAQTVQAKCASKYEAASSNPAVNGEPAVR